MPGEYDVKAVFLLNFTKFIAWPPTSASTNAPFNICIVGEDPLGSALDQVVAGEQVNGRRIAIQRSHRVPEACDVLFVGRTERDPGSILSEVGPGVLTVGETEGFLHKGGIINFVVENRHVRFDINLRNAAKASLQISSKLLSVARRVQT